jgi:hypothetical protein
MTTDGADRSFGAPRFDVVLRGYDRRQVDEHLSRLQRVVSRMRGELDAARGRAVPPPGAPVAPVPPAQAALTGPPTGPFTPPGVRPRPTPRPRPDLPPAREAPDVVGTFTDRMQTILQAAEEEAAEIRAKARAAVRSEEERLAAARSSARAEEEKARVTLANLVRQRDAVLADLTRVRGQLEALLSGPTARIAVPTQDTAAARRDAGAGHPLPGTPVAAAPDDPAASAEPAPEAPEPAAPASEAPAPVVPAPASPVPPDQAPARTAHPGVTAAGASTAAARAAEKPAEKPTEKPAGTVDPPAASGPEVSAVEQTMAMAPARRPDGAKASADDPAEPADAPEPAAGAPDEPAEGERDRVANSR